jgi:adenylate kinase
VAGFWCVNAAAAAFSATYCFTAAAAVNSTPLQDGYPRTVQQAKDLDAAQSVSRVLNITLPESVLMTKLLGRRVCGDCGKNYNLAAIHEGDLDMPPLLPKPSDCAKCVGKPRLEIRADDTEAVVTARMKVYHAQTAPLIAYYQKQGKLQDFAVKKGIADLPRLQKELGM